MSLVTVRDADPTGLGSVSHNFGVTETKPSPLYSGERELLNQSKGGDRQVLSRFKRSRECFPAERLRAMSRRRSAPRAGMGLLNRFHFSKGIFNMKQSTTPQEPGDETVVAGAGQTDESADSIGQLIQSAVSEGFAALRKELAPPRRFISPPESQDFRIPATVKRYSALKHFAGEDADERAYRFGMFCL